MTKGGTFPAAQRAGKSIVARCRRRENSYSPKARRAVSRRVRPEGRRQFRHRTNPEASPIGTKVPVIFHPAGEHRIPGMGVLLLRNKIWRNIMPTRQHSNSTPTIKGLYMGPDGHVMVGILIHSELKLYDRSGLAWLIKEARASGTSAQCYETAYNRLSSINEGGQIC